MPRVITRTRSARPAKFHFTCSKCREKVTEGQDYYEWAIKSARGGTKYVQHVACGRPRASQLSRSRMGELWDAVEDAQASIDAWTPELPEGDDAPGVEDIESILGEVAEAARSVADGYQDGFENMPENLQQGDTGQAMEQTAQELESWADDVEGWSPSQDEPDWPERDDYLVEDSEEDEVTPEYAEARQQAFDDWCTTVRGEALDAIQDHPEYQG